MLTSSANPQYLININCLINIIQAHYQLATKESFEEAIQSDEDIFHFSGHGFSIKDQDLIKKFYDGFPNLKQENTKKGDKLLLETLEGSSYFLFESELKELLRKPTFKPPRIVNLQACYSLKIGQCFTEKGVGHVIVVDGKVKNEASKIFSKVFYDLLFSGKQTPCEAFNQAMSSISIFTHSLSCSFYVQITIDLSRSIKLLTQDARDGLPRGGYIFMDHANSARGEIHPFLMRKDIYMRNLLQIHFLYILLPQGTLSLPQQRLPKVFSIPSKVEPFICRATEMKKIINLAKDSRVIQIIGMPGIGKATLLRNLTHFFGQRYAQYYPDGVQYFDFKQIQSCNEAIEYVIQNYFDFRSNHTIVFCKVV